MEEVAIVIPIYKNIIDQDEELSLLQCIKILNTFKIIFVSHPDLQTESYEKYFNNKLASYKFEHFNKKYFKNTFTYNSLLLSEEFYKRFEDYKYILIYQLDAMVFNNDLISWCERGYDYIGAPWFDDDNNMNTGNGGFSLRSVTGALAVLQSADFYSSKVNIEITKVNKEIVRSWFYLLIRKIIRKLIKKWYIILPPLNEDEIWSIMVPITFKQYKVAPSDVALKFAFEKKPEVLFKKNGNELPFGCHAFQKHNYSFWIDIFQKEGISRDSIMRDIEIMGERKWHN